MKLLHVYDYVYEAKETAKLLEEKGIITHVSSEYSQGLSVHRTGAQQSSLWIVLDFQYEDAKNFLNNKSYNVKTGFDPNEVRDLKNNLKKSVEDDINKVLWITLSLLIIFFIIMVRLFN